MAAREVIIARHGQTELNRVGIVQGSGIDPALNEFGHAQAEALHQHFAGQFDLVVSSGMVRARQTAEPFLADEGVRYVEVPDFREICWGRYEGKAATPEMRADYKRLMSSWESGDYHAKHPGGESAQELADRLRAGWKALEQEKFERALVVSHGRALRCLISLLDGKPLSAMNNYAHANAGYYHVVEMGTGHWDIREHNSVVHLAHLKIETPLA